MYDKRLSQLFQTVYDRYNFFADSKTDALGEWPLPEDTGILREARGGTRSRRRGASVP
jgi:hypothetical protein